MQRKAIMDENDVLCQIVDCYQSNKDNKEYESYNGIENVLKFDNKYLIRVKNIHFRTSLSRLLGPFPDDEFDLDVSRILVLKNIKMVNGHAFITTNGILKIWDLIIIIKAIHKA